MRIRSLVIASVLVAAAALLALVACNKTQQENQPSVTKLSTIRFGVSPFQDTLLPIIGSDKYRGWYRQEGLNVEFRILGWQEVIEALAAGSLDVAVYNDSGIIGVHNRQPDLVYWYGFNTFDNGFALMIRPDGKMKTVAQLEKELGDHNKAVVAAVQQLKGKTIVTTGNTDMEQGVAAAARRGGLKFSKDNTSDIKIVDLPPDEGLAAFLSGTGDAYIGGIPQRTRAGKEGMLELVSGIDLGPAPINGFVTTKTFDRSHREDLLKFLKVWFRIVNAVQANSDDTRAIIVKELNQNSGASFTIDDFNKFWQHYEHYPLSPKEIATDILSPTGRNYWKARWDDDNAYFSSIVKTIPAPVKPDDAFLMPEVQKAFVERYGENAPK
jgi:NitT/TauT family transport system substrate-binding protein